MPGNTQEPKDGARNAKDRRKGLPQPRDDNLNETSMTITEITEALEKNAKVSKDLKDRRKEIKNQLSKEGIRDEDELELVKELQTVCTAIKKLETQRTELCQQLALAKP
jgi:hypothetical protein